MSAEINDNNKAAVIDSVLEKESFINLDQAVQNKIIDVKQIENRHKLGIIGELFGTNPVQIAMYGALIIAFAMLIIVILEFLCSRYSGYCIDMELIEKMFSIITLILGYLFGRGKE